MTEISELICRHALNTGELPTLAELARQMGLSRTRAMQIWRKIERYEQGRDRVSSAMHDRRRQAGYLLAVLKDIEKSAKMAGRVYPWRTKWQGPRQQPEPVKPRPKRSHYAAWRAWRSEEPRRYDDPGTPYKPRFWGLVECRACHGTGVVDHVWCKVCGGEATVMRP
jgi:hypothetical protein